MWQEPSRLMKRYKLYRRKSCFLKLLTAYNLVCPLQKIDFFLLCLSVLAVAGL